MKSFIDSSFPGLAVAFNPEEMIELLRSALKKDYANLEVKEAKILDVKYQPGKESVLLYQFKIKDRLTKISHKLMFTATLLKEEESSPVAIREDFNHKNLLIRNPNFYFEEQRIFLCAFPCDPRMPWLSDALNETFMQERLNTSWSKQNVSVQQVKIDLLDYAPRLRAVFLYHIHIKDNKTGDVSLKELVGKTSSYKVPEILFADLWALWKACENTVAVPRPEAFFSSPPLLLQERFFGKRLGDLINSSRFQDALLQTAQSIAFIHQTKIPLNKMRDPFRETQSLRRWSVVLKNIRSDLARRIQTLQESLMKEMELRTTVTATVHGDFHPGNVLVDDQGVSIIDFDQMAYGDSAADIGRFLASLRVSSLRRFGDLSSLEEARETFLQEYLKTARADVSKIRMFESASLITNAASAFRVQRHGWEKEVLLMLQESEQVFETAKSSSKVSLRAAKEPSWKFEEKKKWLLDPEYMHALLGLYLRREYDVEIFSCDILKTTQTESSFKILYGVNGQKQKKPWNCEVEGVALNRFRKRQLFNQLVSLQEVTDREENAFVIPRPVAYLSPLGTMIQMPLSGTPFSSLLGSPEIPVLTAKLARAISILHSTNLPCGRKQSVQEICKQLERDILKLKAHDAIFFVIASKILAQIVARIPKDNKENAVTIGEFTPDHVLCLENKGMGIWQIEEMVAAHPCVDVGEFLAQIMRLGIERNQQSEAETMARHLRSAYCAFEGEERDLLAEFEALGSLRLACSLARNVSNNSVMTQLLAHGAEMLGGIK